MAEETGLDVPLGSFVLREACRQVVEWGDRDEVAEVLGEFGIRPARLRLE